MMSRERSGEVKWTTSIYLLCTCLDICHTPAKGPKVDIGAVRQGDGEDGHSVDDGRGDCGNED